MSAAPTRHRAVRLTAIMLLIGIGALAIGWRVAAGWHPSDATYPFQGVDVAAAQGPVDWPVVEAGGARFAYLTATIGGHGRDARFQSHWQAAYAAGLGRGAIHVYSLCEPGAAQGNNFNTTVPRDRDALPAAIQIDFSDDCPARPARAALIADIRRTVAMIETHTGKPVLLRIAPRVDAIYALSPAIERPLWRARNFLPPDMVARPWRMWQANDMRRIDGIGTAVHWDVVAQ